MRALEKLSEALVLAEEKKDGLEKMMGLVMLEWKDAEGHFKMLRDFFVGCCAEIESKEKHLKAVRESVRQSCEEFDAKRRSVEEGLKKLDEKERFLKLVLREIEDEKMQFGKVRVSVDEQLKDLVLKEQQFQGLFGSLKLNRSQMEKRENELDAMEESLRKRQDEIDSKEKKLDTREGEVEAKERILEREKNEIGSEKKKLKRRLNELDSKERILVGRENEIYSKEKILARRENEIDSKQKMLDTRNFEVDSKERLLGRRENAMRSEAERMNRRKNEVHSREEKLVNLVKELELKEGILDLKLELISLKNSAEQIIPQNPDSGSPKKRKRCSKNSVPVSPGICDDADEGIDMEKTWSKHAKRRCVRDRFSGQIKAGGLEKSGSNDKSRAPQTTQQHVVVVLDNNTESDAGADSIAGNLASKSAGGDPISPSSSGPVKGKKLARTFNVGETWACYDAKSNMPRSYARIINVTGNGGKARIGVAWLKPLPVYKGETEWVGAGLPVACGRFECSSTSVESPGIFSHRTFYAGESSPCIIIPREGETWAIYKDWDIVAWSSRPQIHRQCECEMVEILSYPRGTIDSSPLRVRVACLYKIVGSRNLFRRRISKNNNEDDSVLIKPNGLYRFSHMVPSVKKTRVDENGVLAVSVFELDPKSLPPGLR